MTTRTLIVVIILMLAGCADEPTSFDWQRVSIPSEANLKSVDFLDDKIGFIGAQQTAALSHHLFRHFDLSDYIETVHINTDSSKYYHVEVSAPKPRPVLFKTVDGGSHWKAVETPFISDIEDIDIISPVTVYVMTREEGLYRTDDRGDTWKRVLSNVAFLGNQRIVENPFRQIYFTSLTTGIAYNEFNGAVVKTNDGGQSWDLISYFNHTETGASVNDLAFPGTSGRGYAAYRSKLLTTSDFGTSWTEVEYQAPDISIGEGAFRQLGFVNETRGFMLSGTTPYMTSDGGNSWQRIHDTQIPNLTATKILATANDELYMQYTGNPSLTYWNTSTGEYRSFTAEGDGSLVSNWCVAGNAIFAVGARGMVLKHGLDNR